MRDTGGISADRKGTGGMGAHGEEPGHRDAREARGSGGQPCLRAERSGGWDKRK